MIDLKSFKKILLGVLLLCFFTLIKAQKSTYIAEINTSSILVEIEFKKSADLESVILINGKPIRIKNFENEFVEFYKRRIKEIPPYKIMTSTISFKISNKTMMSTVDSVRSILSRNSIRKVLYQTDNYPNKGIMIRLYSHEDYGEAFKSPIDDVKVNYFKSLAKKDAKSNIDVENLPPPPPPTLSAPTTYQFLKPYYRNGELSLPFDEGINSIKFTKEKTYITNVIIEFDSIVHIKVKELLRKDGEKIFVLLIDEHTTFKQYLYFLKLLYSNIYKIRNELSIKYYNISYTEATAKQQRYLKREIPLKIIDYSFSQWEKLKIDTNK